MSTTSHSLHPQTVEILAAVLTAATAHGPVPARRITMTVTDDAVTFACADNGEAYEIARERCRCGNAHGELAPDRAHTECMTNDPKRSRSLAESCPECKRPNALNVVTGESEQLPVGTLWCEFCGYIERPD